MKTIKIIFQTKYRCNKIFLEIMSDACKIITLIDDSCRYFNPFLTIAFSFN